MGPCRLGIHRSAGLNSARDKDSADLGLVPRAGDEMVLVAALMEPARTAETVGADRRKEDCLSDMALAVDLDRFPRSASTQMASSYRWGSDVVAYVVDMPEGGCL